MLLVITSKSDGHIEPVTRHLENAGVEWIRLNTEDLATNVEVNIDPAAARGQMYIRDSQREIALEAVEAVWYRKPDPVRVDHFDLEGGALDYVEAEYREILDGFYALLTHVPWINNPFTTRLAHRKMLQLHVARRVGFATPRTLVTNIAADALRFADSVNGSVAVKSLGALSVLDNMGEQDVQYGIFTRRIDRHELHAVADKIGHLPTTFQEFVPKRYELRITCVGRRVFACRIDARAGDLTADDYRFDTANLQHTAIDCPELHDRLGAYMTEFCLNFACFDVIISASGDAVFLEANPNGQWLWVEHLTGLPIGRAVADELLSYCSKGARLR
jgi:glutathione synthase/RimK-type ligase-like ATP-grasp enzyme